MLTQTFSAETEMELLLLVLSSRDENRETSDDIWILFKYSSNMQSPKLVETATPYFTHESAAVNLSTVILRRLSVSRTCLLLSLVISSKKIKNKKTRLPC